MTIFDEIVSSYVATALWSSYDTNDDPDSEDYTGGSPLDINYDVTDISADTLLSFKNDIHDFLSLLQVNGITLNDISKHMTWGQFGHDFWLTRNHHGAGFWDRGYNEQFGEILTTWAQAFSEVNLYVNDDNEIEAI